MNSDFRIGMLFRMINNAVESKMNKTAENFDLTTAQMQVLFYLKMSEGKEVNQKDIEKQFKLSNPTVTGILKRLESKGFIVRHISSQDARCKWIEQTEKSRELNEDVRRTIDVMEKKLTKGMTQKERDTLVVSLQKLLKNIIE